MTATQFFGAVAVVSLAVGALYLPGIGAGFVLDDYGSIKPLGGWGQIGSFDEAIAYLETGIRAGPTGRPVAMMTFLLNGDTWPTSPTPFLITNIIVHIVTTAILCGFLRDLFRATQIRQADLLALLAAICWALHPFQVSTVLYVVQRMTSLAALFCVAALWCYIPLRSALQNGRLKAAVLWALALGANSLLAFGSKEIAILIPQGMLITEWLLGTADGRGRRSAPLRIWLILCGWIPSAIVWGYLMDVGMPLDARADYRDFTLGERLITEIGVMGLYLQHLLIPKIITPGIFYDGYPVVKDFFASPLTIIWAVIHTSVVAVAVLGRRQWPLMTFGVLWFYGWHILESTTVNLELVFEHRNYLPSIGFTVVLAWGLIRLIQRPTLGYGVTAIILLVLVIVLHQRVTFWGNPIERAMIWAEELPESTRAQENAFMVMYATNNHAAGDYYLERSLVLNPDDPYLKLKSISRMCDSSMRAPEIDWELLQENFRYARKDFRLYELLSGLWNKAESGSCNFLNVSHIKAIIAAAMENTKIRRSGMSGHMNQLRGEIFLAENSVDMAIENFRIARHQIHDPSVAIYQARLLAMKGYHQKAISILDEMLREAADNEFLRRQAIDVRQQIRKDANNG